MYVKFLSKDQFDIEKSNFPNLEHVEALTCIVFLGEKIHSADY